MLCNVNTIPSHDVIMSNVSEELKNDSSDTILQQHMQIISGSQTEIIVNDTNLPSTTVQTVEDEAKNTSSTTVQILSKKKLKRLKRNEKWLATKAERKKREKEKRKMKRALMNQTNEVVLSRNMMRAKLVKLADSPCKVSVVIDCDYITYMDEKELRKLCKQLNRCYALNHHSEKPVQLYITSITSTLKNLMEKYQPGYTNWDAYCTEQHWSELFQVATSSDHCHESSESGENQHLPRLNPNIVYLTGDSPDIIDDCTTIQDANNAIFIIGGLIDHNRHKCLALQRAQQFAVRHGQLPISDHIRMAQRRILAIPHVFEIMLYAANGTIGQAWNDILHKVIPARKLATE